MASFPELLSPQPFLRLAESAARWPDSLGLVSPHHRIAFGQLAHDCTRIAVALRHCGVKAGDFVTVDTNAELHFYLSQALFSLCAVGTIYTGRHSKDNPQNFTWRISDTPDDDFPKERTIVVDATFLKEASAIADPLEVRTYDSFTSVARVAYSSGTTGEPLPIPLTVKMIDRRSQIANAYWLPMRPFFSLISLSSSMGLVASLANMATATPYLVPGSSSENLEMITTQFVSCLAGSGVQLAELLQLSPEGKELADVGMIINVGSPPSPQLIQRLRECTNAKFLNVFGATQAGAVMLNPIEEEVTAHFETIIPGVEIDVVDDAGHKLPFGEVGNLRSRSEWQANSYHNVSFASTSSFKDGWFYSGDLARQNQDGTVTLCGRSGEVVNFGGVKVDLTIADHAIREIPGIKDAAVVSLSDEWGVSWPHIAFVRDEGFDANRLKELSTKVLQGLAPVSYQEVSEIPRGTIGKVRRVELANTVRANHHG